MAILKKLVNSVEQKWIPALKIFELLRTHELSSVDCLLTKMLRAMLTPEFPKVDRICNFQVTHIANTEVHVGLQIMDRAHTLLTCVNFFVHKG